MSYQVGIIGGGLAGLTSALQLAKQGIKVLLVEKKTYPFHKFCGEYLSSEVLPYFEHLGLDQGLFHGRSIQRFRFSAPSGRQIETPLPLGGYSISRHTLDQHIYEKALEQGVTFQLGTTVEDVAFAADQFSIHCRGGKEFQAEMVIGSYGKRTNLDQKLSRAFFQRRSSYVGVKHYLKYDWPDDLVAIHNFKGGYCGMVKVENGLLNITYLTTKKTLQKYGKIATMQEAVVKKNPHLAEIFNNGEAVGKPIVISNISFARKGLVENHVLMCGDAAGMIFPICGNGMAMAIHSGKMVSDLLIEYFNKGLSRQTLEQSYQKTWDAQFRNRLFWGRQIQHFMGKPILSELALFGLRLMPWTMPLIIKQTHGLTFS